MNHFITIVLVCQSFLCMAQEKEDMFVLLSNDTIQCVISKISETNIYYQTDSGKTQIMGLQDVRCYRRIGASLQFTKVYLEAERKRLLLLTTCKSKSERKRLYKVLMDSVLQTMTEEELQAHESYLLGKADAKVHYKANGGMFMVYPWYFIPVYLATTPKHLRTSENSNNNLLDDPIYYKGYKRGVLKKKIEKLLKGAAVAGVLVGVYVLLCIRYCSFPGFII